jgi:hypothetical protein
MGDGYCPVSTPSSLVCRIDWPKLNVLHFKQEHRTPRRVTTEPPPEPPYPPHMSSVLGSGGDTNPFEGGGGGLIIRCVRTLAFNNIDQPSGGLQDGRALREGRLAERIIQ